MSRRTRRQEKRVNIYLSGLGIGRRRRRGFCVEDLLQLRTWMRGSATPMATFMGVAYGLAFAMVPAAVLARAFPRPATGSVVIFILILLALAALSIEVCAFAAWAINERILRRSDSFYRYGRACRALIAAGTYSPKRVSSRRYLAEVVGRWSKEATAKHIEASVFQGELDAIVDKKVPSKADLDQVAEIGRRAALALLRGEIDMRALTPELVAVKGSTRVKRQLESLAKKLGTVAPFIAATATLINVLR